MDTIFRDERDAKLEPREQAIFGWANRLMHTLGEPTEP